ncbi:hypothetical protein BCR41DRAFT_410376 [Lobosporangium transversale]|uniref:C2H2-type domain-containing protein n=1 Tax=Lobosporangium transversale TaxID=64571 RepID=A0A1Y2GIG7_9FUNG|nr:hypothetical protein BCR41DRAFT_410376 [Lobosporangium transversale]ORZ10033.1 hypothetical protein BCR41DRAFT_410376 [Lobosporangium transversale]|eukprot:XP_021879123.1 hypothetical protein BCR41DRAFT_410376 [Lobosporangium transversale]
MAHLTPASILASMNNGAACTPSELMNYHNCSGMSPIEDSDSDSSYSGSSSSSLSMNVNSAPTGLAAQNGQPITYHYFCNFPTCDYHSARSDPVKRHRDTHYPDYKPYICNYCQASSARRDSTREHCLKQHKDDSENAFRYDTTIPKPEGWIAYEPKRSPWPPIMI